jgi:hypothetical protein
VVLKRVGIPTKQLGSRELLANASAARVYNDAPVSRSEEIQINPIRLNRAALIKGSGAYDRLFAPVTSLPDRPGPGTPEYDAERVARQAAVQDLLGSAWQSYADATDETPEAAGFADYLLSGEVAANREAINSIVELRTMFRAVQSSGLTPREMRLVTQHILAPITPAQIGAEQMERLVGIDAVTQQG